MLPVVQSVHKSGRFVEKLMFVSWFVHREDDFVENAGSTNPEGLSSRRRVPSLHCHVERPAGVETSASTHFVRSE